MAGSRIITVQLNQKRRPEFANAKVRQAIVYAINNEGIVKKIMKGEALASGQQGPKGFAGYDPALAPRYDLNKAKQLMKDAGYENGFECSMIAPNNRYVNDEKIAEAIVSMLAKIKIKVNLKTMPKAQYWDEFDAQVADIQMIGWQLRHRRLRQLHRVFVHVPRQGNRLRPVQQRQLLQIPRWTILF